MLDPVRPEDLARRLTQGDPDGSAERLAAPLMAAEESFFHVDLADGTVTLSRGIEISLGHAPDACGRTLDERRERAHPDGRERACARGRARRSGAPRRVGGGVPVPLRRRGVRAGA